MKASFISTATFLKTPRSNVSRIQADLDKAVAESSKGRYADVGLELGYRTGLSLNLRQEVDNLDAQSRRNGLTGVRLDSSYHALDRVRTDGEAFLALTTPGKLTDTSGTVVAQMAATKLTALIGDLNTSTSGQYLFGGINTGQRPIADYEASPQSSAKTAFQQAFTNEFHFPPGTQPDTSNITPTQMEHFLQDGGRFTHLFEDNQWKQNWSSASDVNIKSDITRNETVESSVSANAQPLRQIAMMYTLASDIGLASLGPATQNVVYDKLRSLANSGTLGVKDIQADIGVVQARIGTVGKQIDAQKNIMTEGFGKLEAVDLEEVATRTQNLEAQLKVAYSLTGQVSKLNLLDYI
jgi:flagellar hook-associated protein 3 FlgL